MIIWLWPSRSAALLSRTLGLKCWGYPGAYCSYCRLCCSSLSIPLIRPRMCASGSKPRTGAGNAGEAGGVAYAASFSAPPRLLLSWAGWFGRRQGALAVVVPAGEIAIAPGETVRKDRRDIGAVTHL